MIDVHAHFLPDFYLDAMRRAGLTDVDGFPIPHWNGTEMLGVMDAAGIDAAILSISAPGVSFADQTQAPALCREVNHHARALIDAHPRHFGAFALLPLPDVDAALTEISYSLDELRLDGIGLYTNHGGRYLSDPMFEPVMAELDRRAVVCFVHPTQPPAFDQIGLGFSAPIMEYPFETTRAIASLLRAGTFARYPRMKWIFTHGGGTLPYLAPRITRTLPLSEPNGSGFDTPTLHRQLRNLYYDLAASTHHGALAALLVMVPPTQLLAGFDFPFMRPLTIAPAQGSLLKYSEKVGIDLRGATDENAQRIFPRFAR